MLNEEDNKTFEIIFENAISQISTNQQTCEFAYYFVGHCGNFNPSYAYCHRIYARVNINQNIQRIHQILNHIYLQRRKLKRLDA